MVFGLAWTLVGCGGSEPGIADPTSVPSNRGFVASPSTVPTEAPTPGPVAEVPAPELPSQSSSAVVVSADGTLVIAVNPDSDSVTIVDTMSLEVIREVSVGRDPRTVAFGPGGSAAFVANHGSGTVTRIDLRSRSADREWAVGATAYGIVVSEDVAYVSDLVSGTLTALDTETGEVLNRVEVGAFPAGLALTGGADQTLLVAHLLSADLTVMDLPSMRRISVLSSGVDANLSQSVTVGPEGRTAYLPQTRSNSDSTVLTFDNTVLPIVTVVDLSELRVVRERRVTLETADEPVNMPFSVALTDEGRTMFVSNAGSNDVSVINLETGFRSAHIEVGANPRGIAATADGSRLFVNNVLDGTLSVINGRSLFVEQTVILTEIPLNGPVLLGKKLFNNSSDPALARDRWVSCASCHFDGMHDGRTWVGFPDGPRNTPSLLGVRETLPIHWSGDLDELHDVELTVRETQKGAGLVDGDTLDSLGPAYAGRSERLDALAEYLTTLDAPRPLATESLLVNEGRALFEALNCATCHPEPLYTDVSSHDVGTGDPALERNSHGRRTSFDTPGLRGIRMTAPYCHDGGAPTLRAVFDGRASSDPAHAVRGRISSGELGALVAFLRTL